MATHHGPPSTIPLEDDFLHSARDVGNNSPTPFATPASRQILEIRDSLKESGKLSVTGKLAEGSPTRGRTKNRRRERGNASEIRLLPTLGYAHGCRFHQVCRSSQGHGRLPGDRDFRGSRNHQGQRKCGRERGQRTGGKSGKKEKKRRRRSEKKIGLV